MPDGEAPTRPGSAEPQARSLGEHRLARAAHFGILWLLVGFVFAASFVLGHGVFAAICACALAGLVVAGLATTLDQGHLVGARVEDAPLALLAATVAAVSVRVVGAPPVLTSALVGTAGALLARHIDGVRDPHGGPVYVGAFVGERPRQSSRRSRG